ncbi:hypothetical protein ABIB50_003507 [Mucilaginibacter sp. UYCu711]
MAADAPKLVNIRYLKFLTLDRDHISLFFAPKQNYLPIVNYLAVKTLWLKTIDNIWVDVRKFKC